MKRIHLSVPHMGGAELRYVEEAFSSNWLSTTGPNVDALENRFKVLVGRPAAALASGTAALHLAVKLLRLGSGDEVITPSLSFVASCNPLLYENAVPVLIDSDYGSWNLDPQLLGDFLKRRARINRLPKAAIVVHLFGQSDDLDPILTVCRHYELPLIEDAAESLGATYRNGPVGSFGDVGVYSFNGNKVITGSSGGMLVSPRAEWVEKARFWASRG